MFVAAATGAVLAGAVALAVIPDQDGVIHGCRGKFTGNLRVIDHPDEHCARWETQLDWNQTGPQGPAGAFSSYVVSSGDQYVPVGQQRTISVMCDAGDVAVAGGYDGADASPVYPANQVRQIRPIRSPGAGTAQHQEALGWEANVMNNTSMPQLFRVFTTCVER